jgi:hypothetical protein
MTKTKYVSFLSCFKRNETDNFKWMGLYVRYRDGHAMTRYKAGNPMTSHKAGHPTTSHRAGHPTTSHRAGHPTTSHRAGHPTTSHRAGHPTTSHRAGHPMTSHRAGHPMTSHRAGHTLSSSHFYLSALHFEMLYLFISSSTSGFCFAQICNLIGRFGEMSLSNLRRLKHTGVKTSPPWYATVTVMAVTATVRLGQASHRTRPTS